MTTTASEQTQAAAPQANVPESLPAPRTAQRPTHFSFDHPVFSVKEACFVLSATNGQPCYNVPPGDVRHSLSPNTLAASFGIAKGSTDEQLLGIVRHSLKSVKETSHGASIPSEILDDTAPR